MPTIVKIANVNHSESYPSNSDSFPFVPEPDLREKKVFETKRFVVDDGWGNVNKVAYFFYWFIDTALKSFDITLILLAIIVHDKWTDVTSISFQQLTSQFHLHNIFKFSIHYNFMCTKCERQIWIGRRVVVMWILSTAVASNSFHF